MSDNTSNEELASLKEKRGQQKMTKKEIKRIELKKQ